MSFLSQIDHADASEETRAAYDEEERERGHVTNMKRTLLHSLPAFHAYMEWYTLRDTIVPVIGERAADVFAHTISTENDCLICSTFFRRILIDSGISPDAFEPTADEALLIEFGRAIVRHPNGVDAGLWWRLKARFSEPELVNLVAFAGLMVATNLFNNVVAVELDHELQPYRKA